MAQKILIVDDDAAIAELLAQALGDEGYETHTSIQSLRFFDAVKEINPDLILLDLMMPYLDGRDELRLMSMEPGTQNIPVIMVTANVDAKNDEETFKKLGVKEVILKPFDLSSLVSTVKRTIGEPERALS